MDELTDDDLLLDLIESVTRDVLDRIGDDPRAWFAIFKRLLAVAQEVAKQRGQCGSWTVRSGSLASTTTQDRYVGSGRGLYLHGDTDSADLIDTSAQRSQREQ